METLLIEGVKYRIYKPQKESELENMVRGHVKDIFGEDSLYFEKQKIKSRAGIGSIPDGCYFLQKVISNHFIGCYTPENPVKGTNKDSSLESMREMSRRMIRFVPELEDMKILRQWGGSYCMTPDGSPMLDKTEIDGLYVAGGMSGHGFMLGPMLGKLMAEFMTTGTASIPLDEFSLKRKFAKREALK